MDRADILKNAIKGEVDGFNFYNLLADKCANADAKRRLLNLRDDERRHGTVLIDMYEKLIGGEVGELPGKGIGPLADFFSNAEYREQKSENEYISLAIEVELAATKFYKEMAVEESDGDFKEILNKLSEEEYGHYEILMAEKEALAGNYYWFSAGDTAPMED